MTDGAARYVFGPVPSRRLGRSLGINNIPPKICTYSCRYCQVGRTLTLRTNRGAFRDPADLLEAVEGKVKAVLDRGERIDYLTFVSDGEPTLDVNLGAEIDGLRSLGIPIAVITNASLIDQATVRAELAKADWVSVKVDTVDEAIWRRLNRPHKSLRLAAILDGIVAFAESFQGRLVTETMLVAGINDHAAAARGIAAFLGRIRPATAYLSVPTRPPAEKETTPPAAEELNRAYQIVRERIPAVEYLVGYEGDAFASTGDVAEDLLSITAVHPLREDAVEELLARTTMDWSAVRTLIADGLLEEVEYGGKRFYLRQAPRRR